MAVENAGGTSIDRTRILSALRLLVATLAGLLALSLLVVGTVAVIAELKGTWHWAIHLESTISYVGLFVSRLLIVLGPAFAALLVARWAVDDG